MRYTVSAAEQTAYRLNETDTARSVLQNIALILSTRKGTVPMYRDFGVDMDFLDLPRPVAEVRMVAEIREAVETWEPRATVKDVRFLDGGGDGVLVPVVEVEINE